MHVPTTRFTPFKTALPSSIQNLKDRELVPQASNTSCQPFTLAHPHKPLGVQQSSDSAAATQHARYPFQPPTQKLSCSF